MLLLTLLLGACSGPTPTTTLAARSEPVTPSTSFDAQSPSTSDHEIVQLAVESIPQHFTTPLLEVSTDGQSIAWSTGAEAGPGVAPDVFRFDPGNAAPHKVFTSADRKAIVGPIAISGSDVALVEANPEAKPGTWQLWYVGESGVPKLVDHSDDDLQGPYPFVAMDHGRLVWTAFHSRPEGPRSELWMAWLPALQRELLDVQPLDQVEHWFPAIDGDHVVYGTVETTATSVSRHVYLRDLGSSNTAAVRIDTSGHASMPAISGDMVVWKESPDNVLERGTLVLFSLKSQRAQPIAFGDESAVNTPSIGNRFVAANVIDPTRFFLYDLVSQRSILLRDFPPAGREVIVRPSVRGDMAVWSHAPESEGADLALEWSRLPTYPAN